MSEQSTPAERAEPVAPTPADSTPPAPAAEPVDPLPPGEPVDTTAAQPAVVDAPPPPVYAAAPVPPPVVKRRRGWLPYLAVGLAGVLIGILLTCSAGLLFRLAWGHHGFDGGPGRHMPMQNQRPGPGFGDNGGPFRR